MKRRTTVLVTAFTLLIFGGVIALVTLRLRERVRDEILQRASSILSAVARREARHDGQTLIDLVLRVIDLDGIIGVRVFDADGNYVRALPDNLVAGTLDRGAMLAHEVACHLTDDVRLCTIYADPFGELGDRTLPMLTVDIPIRGADGTNILGFAEFLADGRTTAAAFHRLDRDLRRQSLTAFLGGGLLIVAILLYSTRQLERKNMDLAAANRQLALHAKTAAVGAIASHLFHSLKNAMSGLHLAIDADSNSPADARADAHRIQQMIQDVTDLIREEQQGLTYDLTTHEILELVKTRTREPATARHVDVRTTADRNRPYANRDANLILLVLINLVNNAIEASPAGQTVSCTYAETNGKGVFTVTDRGPGIPERRRQHPFEPGNSTKPGGNGIGLAISRELCRHLGGKLRLVRTGPDGTTFALTFA